MKHFGQLDIQLTVPMKYFGTVNYYAAMAACSRVIIDDTARYDKRQKDTHRLDIIDTHGVKSLTVPVSKPDGIDGSLRWSHIGISRHGQWWHVIAETLASAYGRTPFFEFYIDRLRPFFSADTPDRFTDVASLCRGADTAVRAILGLDNDITYASESPARAVGMHPGASAPTTAASALPAGASVLHDVASVPPSTVEYYQVRRDRFGFVSNLSILDLIFNMGPESALILHRMCR